ncbi:MAG: thiamine pyrophosphate-dependent enzyme [Planctomycetota bacterium]|nr:thiamine pyrophosphate-dependent enzyme [Planctomycetota bacterium]
MATKDYHGWVKDRIKRAAAIAKAGGFEQALASGALPKRADITLSEAVVLGLIRQDVRLFVGVFGHGSTEIAEVLRVYEDAGLVRTCGVRSEVEAAHAATALRWVTGEKAAVFTSIGPGALHALAGSLVSASDGVGVWHLYGDETTQDEGPNMQQIPKQEQGLFLNMVQTMGRAYCLHTPESITVALRRGLNTVDHPYRQGPFYLLMPMNTRCSLIRRFNLDELPVGPPPALNAACDEAVAEAVEVLAGASRVVVKVGGGARCGGKGLPELQELLELIDGVAVTSPLISGIIPSGHPRDMTVGGSKGSLCGNYAMDQADLLVAIGTRFVGQSDCSRTGYPNVRHVVNINADIEAAMHYNKTTALVGDVSATLKKLIAELKSRKIDKSGSETEWFKSCAEKKNQWEAFKAERYKTPCLHDEAWGRDVLTQPAAIKAAVDWARENDAVTFFDAGDVQANGFQTVSDDRLGRTFTDTGASYMGFAVSALLATGLASPDKKFYGLAFSGDGSFTMNPQILIDGVEHGARGCILLFDNRRMAAISGLQFAQCENDYATNDGVEVDYVAWAASIKGVAAFHGGYSTDQLLQALAEARRHDGISLIHVPVYFGPDELGGMGVFGRWNVGNWCEDVQAMRHDIGL